MRETVTIGYDRLRILTFGLLGLGLGTATFYLLKQVNFNSVANAGSGLFAILIMLAIASRAFSKPFIIFSPERMTYFRPYWHTNLIHYDKVDLQASKIPSGENLANEIIVIETKVGDRVSVYLEPFTSTERHQIVTELNLRILVSKHGIETKS